MNTFYRLCTGMLTSACEIQCAEMKGHLPLKRGLYQISALHYMLLQTSLFLSF